MAKSRAKDSTRTRVPPPPRMTGMGLGTAALVGGLGAAVLALLSVALAAGSADPSVDRHADSLGAGLVALLTAPEPDWWALKHDTWEEKYGDVRKPFGSGVQWPTDLPAEIRKSIAGLDFGVTERNKKRLRSLMDTLGLGLDAGTLRGLQLTFTRPGLVNHSAGARITPTGFQSRRTLGTDIHVGSATATNASGAGTFTARVYHREYRDSTGARVGDAYAILSEAALETTSGAGLWLLLAPLLVGGAAALFIVQASKAAQGLQNLSRDLDTIGRGKLDLRVTTSGPGEVGLAQRAAERMAANLQLIQTSGAKDLDEVMEKELELATQIHESLRPAEPPRLPGYELETLFKSGRAIGGDYIDYVETEGGRVAILLADCSESLRGVPAAMVMAMTRAYLRTAVDVAESPAEWLKWVNRRLARDLKSGMAVTALAVSVDTSTGELVAASAGHRPIVMWREGKTALINPNGIALGLDVGPVFDKTIEEKRITMKKNDRVVLYTDGVIGAENQAGEAYGDARFVESVRRQGGMNSAAFVNFVAGGVDKFLDGAEQTDDITICTLKKMK